MAVHLLEGHMVGGRRSRQIIGQRETLLALGTITAGLTHQLNNPAAAIARDVASLRENFGKMRQKLAMLGDGKFTPEALRVLVQMQDEVAEEVAKSKGWSSRRWRPRIGRIRSATGSTTTASPAAGTTRRRSSRPAWAPIGWNASRHASGGRLLGHTADCCRLAEIHHRHRAFGQPHRRGQQAHLGIAGRYQAVLADGPCPYQSADVHDLLRSTLMMFGEKVGKGGPIRVVKEFDTALPELLCYPGDLNQVWTNLFDNARSRP